MPTDPARRGAKKGDPGDLPGRPSGPQPHGPDEAAGGADSSPHENETSGERKKEADAGRRPSQNDDPSVAPESGDRKGTGN